jgi:xylan 1,4-beta-xylosidase
LEIPAPHMIEVKWEKDYEVHDDFDKPELSRHFQSLRIPLSENIATLKERAGYLRLYGKESNTSLFTQAFVARRWQSFNFNAETKVEFNPKTFQQRAGLVCYYNTLNWTSLYITYDEEKGKALDIMTADNGEFEQPLYKNEIIIPENVAAVYIKVKVREEKYTYHYSFDGSLWQAIPHIFESYKLSDDYVTGGGFFTGAFVGMHCQDTTGNKLYADFDYFKYEEL